MALSPNDPYRSVSPEESADALRERARLDNEMQADPELAEGEASGGRIGLYAIAVVAILGAVFYGLNSSNTTPNTNTAAQTSTSAPATPASPPPPASNQAAAPTSPPGQTTGSAASSPATPPASNDPAPPVSAPQANPTGQDAAQPGAAGPSTGGTSNSNQ